jgi:MFS family permease
MAASQAWQLYVGRFLLGLDTTVTFSTWCSGWTLLMAASQAWQLYVGRVLLGLGAGLEITISPVYIHETTKSEMRDVCGSFPQV